MILVSTMDAGVKILGKIRVYELAKEMNTTSKRLMEKLAEINIVVKNHMSLLEEHELEALYDHIGVIKHKEENDDKKAALQALYANENINKEARKEAKKAPRIIRTTEIILDSDNEEKNAKNEKSNDSAKKADSNSHSKKKRNDFVKVAPSNSGLRPGFVRETKPEYLRALETEKKQEVTKIADTREKGDAQKEVKKNVHKGAVAEQKQEIKSMGSNEEAKVANVNADQKVKAETKSVESKSSEAKMKQGENANSKEEVKVESKTEIKVSENAVQNKNDNNQQKSNVTEDKTGNNRPVSVDKQENVQSKQEDQSNRPHSQNKHAQEGKTHNEDNRSNLSKDLHNKSNFAAKVSDASKADSVAKKDEVNTQRNENRREFSNKDMEKDAKREFKREFSKASIKSGNAKNQKNTKKYKNVFSGRKEVSQILADDSILQELYDDDVKKAKKPKKEAKEAKKEEKHIPPKPVLTSITIPETLTVKELAEALKKAAAEVIKKLMSLGVMATVNQEIDFDTAAIVADEFGVKAEKEVVISEEDILFDDSEEDDESQLVPRPPVVVVMGHVDHGKTSLLDAIKSSHVTESEAGGITQHIGAYMVKVNNRNITFLDTPGHEAFTAMRARGAQVTDIAILVVAADDGVMPQTIEAINHAKAANVTIIVAINKIDKPGANPERVKQELTEHGLIPEEWGGDTIFVEVSAKQRINIDGLLEMVLLAADMLELKANPNRQAKGTVIEAKLDKDRGPIATVLVQRGTLQVGNSIITGTILGRVRAMVDEKGQRLKKAGPSTPVEILGLPEVPEAGETFYAVTDEKLAKQLIEKRKLKQREQTLKATSKVSLDDLFNQIKEGKVKELNIIVKADVQGSVEAVKQSLEKLSNEEVRVKIIHGAVGAITETDVTLAQVSNAIIIGFNVRPAAKVAEIAKDVGVDIRLYRIIYNAIEDIQAAMKGMLEPTYKEVVIGHIEIRQIFKVSGVGTIGGGYVLDGKVQRNSEVRVVRDGIVVHEGKLASLKRFKDDVKEVAQGFECGLSIERFNDIKVGDVIEAYVMEEVKR